MSTKNEDSHGKHDEHKEITIVINGTEVVVQKERLTFEEIIALGFENPPTGDGVQFTVQYSRGHSDKPKGTLIEGQSVQAKEGMEFDVTPTNRS
ncbi:MAG TPA: multiubiquitin domain-containing protein [Gallionella sp.]|nr:multiubiquitin domain-containing protein [Gallionella sp.]